MSIDRLNEVWPEWKVVNKRDDKLGEGSYGVVYKAVRKDLDKPLYSAIKVISIPKNESELNSMRSEGLTEGATQTYFRRIKDDFVNEIQLMESMKGTQNIVSVEDYKVLDKKDGFGWDVFIRMELLTSFNNYISDKRLTEADVIKLGEHILGALELCSKRDIIHRDIKPENIFISSFGFFKLGDFGIARELGKSTGSMSKTGTDNYMAPEVLSGRYDPTVDIYSLGLVLYKLLNNNRLPFVDPFKQLLQPDEFAIAREKRKKGEPLEPPVEASRPMAQVILKACAFNPRDRYQTPQDFLRALESVKEGKPIDDFSPSDIVDRNDTIRGRKAKQAENYYDNLSSTSNSGVVKRFDNKKKKNKSPKFAIIAILILILGAVGVGGYFYLSKQVEMTNASRVTTALQNKDYPGAKDRFDELDGKGIDGLEDDLSQLIDATENDFKSEAIDYNEAMMVLNTIKSFGIENLSSKISTTEQYIENLNNSRVAYVMAETLYNSGNYIGAIEQYKLVSIDDTNYEMAKEKLTRVVVEYKKSALEESALLMENKDYGSALVVLDKTLEVVGNDSELSLQRDIYQKQGITNKINDSKKLADNGDYSGANNELRLLKAQYPDNTDVDKALLDVETSQVNAIVLQVNGLSTDNKFDEALTSLNDASRLYPNNATLKNTIADTQNRYATNSIAKADELVEQRRFDDAITLLNSTLIVIPDNTTIKEKVEQITSLKPAIFLDAVPAYDVSGDDVQTRDFVLIGGNRFDNALTFSNIRTKYSLHNLNGQYKTITGYIGRVDDTEQRYATYNFYLDGKLEQTYTLQATDLAKQISLDVTDVHQLKIEVDIEVIWNWSSNATYAFASAVIEK